MSHTITLGPHPDIILVDVYGDGASEDVTLEYLSWDQARPLYIMLDASRANISLPENFLDDVKRGPLTQDNLGHLAMYLASPVLRSIARMVVKLTRSQEKVSLHNTREGAIAHLQNLIDQS